MVRIHLAQGQAGARVARDPRVAQDEPGVLADVTPVEPFAVRADEPLKTGEESVPTFSK
jgi:hypothetical protein